MLVRWRMLVLIRGPASFQYLYSYKKHMAGNIIHTNIEMIYRFFLRRELTRHAILWSLVWPTVLVRKVKRKPCDFEAYIVGSYVQLSKHLSNHMQFVTNGVQMLVVDQLARSKAFLTIPVCYTL